MFVLRAAGLAANEVMEMPLQVHAQLAVATWLCSSLEKALYSQALQTQTWGYFKAAPMTSEKTTGMI